MFWVPLHALQTVGTEVANGRTEWWWHKRVLGFIHLALQVLEPSEKHDSAPTLVTEGSRLSAEEHAWPHAAGSSSAESRG